MTVHYNLEQMRQILIEMAESLERDRAALQKYVDKGSAPKLVVQARTELLDQRENHLRSLGGHLVAAEQCMATDLAQAFTRGKKHRSNVTPRSADREAQRYYNIARAREIWDF